MRAAAPMAALWLLARATPEAAGQPAASQPASPPAAQPTSQPATQPASQPSDADLEAEFAGTLAADQAEVQARAGAAAPSAAPPTLSSTLLNPEISAIGVFTASWWPHDWQPTFLAGDDPAHEGATLQELELALASDVDPYFRMRVYLAIPNLEGLEVEEAYLLTTQLPWGALLKAGVLRSSITRNNEQHLHVQDFALRPRTTELLGDDGLRGPGAQLSVLVPLPWWATLAAEVFSLADDPSGLLVLDQFFDMTPTWGLAVRAGGGLLARPVDEEEPFGAAFHRDYLAAGSVYLKWLPVNVTRTYAWAALGAEYVASRPRGAGDWDGVATMQGVAQLARRWRLGLRFDAVGFPSGAALPDRELDTSLSLTFLPSEFSRLRLTGVWEHGLDEAAFDHTFLFLQLEAAIGPHGAHPF